MVGFFYQCKSDRSEESGFNLRLRIKDEPDCLNPIVSQSAIATQIEALVMFPLFEYDMDKLELSPLMVEKMSEAEIVNDSTVAYSYRIRQEAKWDDGQAVTAADVAFTVKAALNPFVKNPNWKSALQNIIDVQGEGKDLKVWVERKYLLSQEVSGNINIYPAHIYDPQKNMQDVSISALKQNDSTAFTSQQWMQLKNFADVFQSDSICRKGISGAGPYALKRWDAGSKIVLEKKKNWWGVSFADSIPMLSQFPDRIEYYPRRSICRCCTKGRQYRSCFRFEPKIFCDFAARFQLCKTTSVLYSTRLWIYCH
jgi:peptide/nickel transport system substrate-binding protein